MISFYGFIRYIQIYAVYDIPYTINHFRAGFHLQLHFTSIFPSYTAGVKRSAGYERYPIQSFILKTTK